MASIASSLGTSTDAASAASTTSNALTTSALGNETTFLQLLVTEIKNQDPTQPMDSTTFLTQLAQFSQLEQMAGIRQDIETGTYDAPASTANTSTPAADATTNAANAAAAAAAANATNTAQQDLTNTALTSGV
jgi:flagellar basal-body rod modification protein FlgD